MYITETVVLFRGAERLMIVGGAILALYIGYRLFVTGILNKQSGEFSVKSFSIKLLNVGPGIFFALFGTCVLVFMISTNATIRFSSGEGREIGEINISFFGGSNRSRIEHVIEEIAVVKTAISNDVLSARPHVAILTSSQKTLARVLLGDEIYTKCEFDKGDDTHDDCARYDQLIK